jgi:hypothetical protein
VIGDGLRLGGDVVDGLSVGELLLDADLTARAMLWNPDPDSAKAKVRTWGEVVDATADLWAAIPDRTGDPSMDRIHRLAQTLHRTWQRAGWPGAGDPDPHLEHVTDNLTRAADLVTTRRPDRRPTDAGHADAEAARTRLMHVLYVATHGAGTALGGHARDLQRTLDARQRVGAGDSVLRARNARDRLGAVERLAGSYLRARWPAALSGEHRDPVDATRLERALARWDVQAHKTLAAPPVAANLLYTAKVERDLPVATAIVTAAAATRGLIDARQQAERLRPALAGLEQSWTQLGTDLAHLTGRHRRLDPELLLAGNELRAALRAITHDSTGVATPAAIADRTDLTVAIGSLQRSITTAVDLGHVLSDALQDPELTVSATGAYALAAATSSASERLGSWVDVGDIHHDRPVTPPPPVRQALEARAASVTAAAATADSAGAFLLDQPPTPPPQTPVNGRAHEDRTPPTLGHDAPGIRCER